MKTMAFEIIGDLLIAVHGEDPMTEEEGRIGLEALKKVDIKRMRSLVYTKGGGPNAAQRRAMTEVYRGRSVPTAVISDARMVRGIVTAMAWFNPSMRAFAVDELDKALRFLDVPEGQRDIVRRTVDKLMGEVEAASVKPTTGRY